MSFISFYKDKTSFVWVDPFDARFAISNSLKHCDFGTIREFLEGIAEIPDNCAVIQISNVNDSEGINYLTKDLEEQILFACKEFLPKKLGIHPSNTIDYRFSASVNVTILKELVRHYLEIENEVENDTESLNRNNTSNESKFYVKSSYYICEKSDRIVGEIHLASDSRKIESIEWYDNNQEPISMDYLIDLLEMIKDRKI